MEFITVSLLGRNIRVEDASNFRKNVIAILCLPSDKKQINNLI